MQINYTVSDLALAFHQAPNVNSALKSFLKNEVRKGDPAGKFIKALRNAATSPAESMLEDFLSKYHERYEQLLLAVIRYAYSAQMLQISEPVIEKYADEFNSTYDLSSGEIEIKDRARFEKISKESVALMGSEIAKAELPAPSLMLRVLMAWVFEEQVLPEVLAANNFS